MLWGGVTLTANISRKNNQRPKRKRFKGMDKKFRNESPALLSNKLSKSEKKQIKHRLKRQRKIRLLKVTGALSIVFFGLYHFVIYLVQIIEQH